MIKRHEFQNNNYVKFSLLIKELRDINCQGFNIAVFYQPHHIQIVKDLINLAR